MKKSENGKGERRVQFWREDDTIKNTMIDKERTLSLLVRTEEENRILLGNHQMATGLCTIISRLFRVVKHKVVVVVVA